MPLEPIASRIPRHPRQDAFRRRSLGAPLTFASDWPVSDASVLRGIKAALTRCSWAAGLPESG